MCVVPPTNFLTRSQQIDSAAAPCLSYRLLRGAAPYYLRHARATHIKLRAEEGSSDASCHAVVLNGNQSGVINSEAGVGRNGGEAASKLGGKTNDREREEGGRKNRGRKVVGAGRKARGGEGGGGVLMRNMKPESDREDFYHPCVDERMPSSRQSLHEHCEELFDPTALNGTVRP